MRRLCLALCILGGLAVVVATSGSAEAYTVFKKPFQQRYGFRSVSCFSCHEKGKDKDGKPLGKEFLNELGKDMKKLFVESNLAERLDGAKKADSESKKKVHEEISKEFLQAIEKFETMKSPRGDPWGELIKAGKIEGVKMRKPKKEEAP